MLNGDILRGQFGQSAQLHRDIGAVADKVTNSDPPELRSSRPNGFREFLRNAQRLGHRLIGLRAARVHLRASYG